MNKVEVKVIQLELGEGIIERCLDYSRVMLGVPELRSDEDVFALESWNVLERTLDSLGDFFLVLVTIMRQLAHR